MSMKPMTDIFTAAFSAGCALVMPFLLGPDISRLEAFGLVAIGAAAGSVPVMLLAAHWLRQSADALRAAAGLLEEAFADEDPA